MVYSIPLKKKVPTELITSLLLNPIIYFFLNEIKSNSRVVKGHVRQTSQVHNLLPLFRQLLYTSTDSSISIFNFNPGVLKRQVRS